MDIVGLTYICMVVQLIPLLLTVLLGIWLFRILRSETVDEIIHTSSLLASAQTSLTYAEIPFPLLAVIAHLYGTNMNEFQKLWIKEKEKRCRKVLEVYKKDCLTTSFIQKYDVFHLKLKVKFVGMNDKLDHEVYLLHGYVGSEAILSSCIQSESQRSPMTRGRQNGDKPGSSRADKSLSAKSASEKQRSSSTRRQKSGKKSKEVKGVDGDASEDRRMTSNERENRRRYSSNRSKKHYKKNDGKDGSRDDAGNDPRQKQSNTGDDVRYDLRKKASNEDSEDMKKKSHYI
ncbi:unnamed protein product [Cylicostephanus goldi]|uniref:Uncharacterized protein n=1 Tax=Cylicostephanus goldi TaxID=71465 RepID=A0A3P6PWJ3_CYLGO|nr:unnamed protein product [Cylicostephanus goldi]